MFAQLALSELIYEKQCYYQFFKKNNASNIWLGRKTMLLSINAISNNNTKFSNYGHCKQPIQWQSSAGVSDCHFIVIHNTNVRQFRFSYVSYIRSPKLSYILDVVNICVLFSPELFFTKNKVYHTHVNSSCVWRNDI